MKDYDAYLFDWDGTLADSNAFWIELVRWQLERYDIHLDDRTITKQFLGRYRQGITEVGIPKSDEEALKKELLEAGAKGMATITLFPDVLKMLHTLDGRGKKIALITASFRDVVDIAIRNHELIDIFDAIVTGDQIKAPKPDPESLEIALKSLGAAPDKAIMIGDSPKDLLAGKNAGTDSLLFFPPGSELHHHEAELQGCAPTYTVSSWQEFLDQLQ